MEWSLTPSACSRTGPTLLLVPMHGVRRERRHADGDVLRAFGSRRAVANPFARRGHHGLSRVDVERAAFVLHAHHTAEHDRNLLELRPLTRFHPPGRRGHPRHAHGTMARVDAS